MRRCIASAHDAFAGVVMVYASVISFDGPHQMPLMQLV